MLYATDSQSLLFISKRSRYCYSSIFLNFTNRHLLKMSFAAFPIPLSLTSISITALKCNFMAAGSSFSFLSGSVCKVSFRLVFGLFDDFFEPWLLRECLLFLLFLFVGYWLLDTIFLLILEPTEKLSSSALSFDMVFFRLSLSSSSIFYFYVLLTAIFLEITFGT